MANRILKESIRTSAQIDALSWFEEIVFYRLMVTADDYGRMDGRIILLKNTLFPLKEDVTKEMVRDAVDTLVAAGLLRAYTAEGMPYLCFPTWEKHQRVRTKRGRYPAPPASRPAPTAEPGANAPEPADAVPPPESASPEADSASSEPPSPQRPFPADGFRNPPAGSGNGEISFPGGFGGLTPDPAPLRESPADVLPTPAAPESDPLCAYAAQRVESMTPEAMRELLSYREAMPDQVIRLAITEARSSGVPKWSYLRAILRSWKARGIRTVQQAVVRNNGLLGEIPDDDLF